MKKQGKKVRGATIWDFMLMILVGGIVYYRVPSEWSFFAFVVAMNLMAIAFNTQNPPKEKQ